MSCTLREVGKGKIKKVENFGKGLKKKKKKVSHLYHRMIYSKTPEFRGNVFITPQTRI